MKSKVFEEANEIIEQQWNNTNLDEMFGKAMSKSQGACSDSTEAMRKAFEAWYTKRSDFIYINDDGKYYGSTLWAWLAWQAAQANQEAIIKATIDAAATKAAHYLGGIAGECLAHDIRRDLDVQEILKNL